MKSEMAANLDQSLFQCSSCHGELNLDSKTLPCLHSLCHPCLKKYFEGEKNENCECPECQKPIGRNQLVLSPFLVKLIRCRQLELAEWRCDLCLEDGIKVHAKKWCHECQKLLCDNCSRIHKKFETEHTEKDLGEIERSEVKKAMMSDMCTLHQKDKDLYCERCNECFCDTCYLSHSIASPRCHFKQLYAKVEALKKKSEGPTLTKKIDYIEMNVRYVNEKTRNSTKELNSKCDLECEKVWQKFDEMMKNAKRRAEELCEEIRLETEEQVKRLNHILEENEKILKQLEIWRINLRHLLSDSLLDVDIICGLQLLGEKLTSLQNEPIQVEEKCELEVSYTRYWEKLESEKIGSAYLRVEELTTQHLQLNKVWDVCWNADISSIIVSNEDNHIFLGDRTNSSIMEFTEGGTYVHECVLLDRTNYFYPSDMCWISGEIFVVCGEMKKLIFMKRGHSSFKMEDDVDTEEFYYSLCKVNDTIYACNLYFQVDSFNNVGVKIRTVKNGQSWDKFSWPLIRADPFTGDFLVTRIHSWKIIASTDGKRQTLLDNKEPVLDFCVNGCGHVYFCNLEGIFLLSPKKKLHKFEKKLKELPRITVLRDKIFVSLKNDGKNSIEIFKIKK